MYVLLRNAEFRKDVALCVSSGWFVRRLRYLRVQGGPESYRDEEDGKRVCRVTKHTHMFHGIETDCDGATKITSG